MSIKKPSFEIIRQLIPPLSHEFHKGQAGMGADLSHVLCHPSASTAIKVKKDDEGGFLEEKLFYNVLLLL
ncbi:6553_t:CDS:2 [Entrophospora sp. SA101]|nr:6553_t:CDS:2 [Entrophospora sp. SA101]